MLYQDRLTGYLHEIPDYAYGSYAAPYGYGLGDVAYDGLGNPLGIGPLLAALPTIISAAAPLISEIIGGLTKKAPPPPPPPAPPEYGPPGPTMPPASYAPCPPCPPCPMPFMPQRAPMMPFPEEPDYPPAMAPPPAQWAPRHRRRHATHHAVHGLSGWGWR